MRWIVGTLVLGLAVFGAGHWTAKTREARAELGRQIFHEGLGREGRAIRTVLAPERTARAAPPTACASCHGPDGRGTELEAPSNEADRLSDRRSGDELQRIADGVVAVPSIRAEALFNERRSADGRLIRPAYTARTFADVLEYGHDPTGRVLSSAMPRLELHSEELAALLFYVRRMDQLERERSKGPTVAMYRPRSGPDAEMREVAWQVIEALISERNVQGGILGRPITLMELDDPSAPPPPSVIALVASPERPDLAAVAQVAPLSLRPRLHENPLPNVFHLTSSIEAQARWMVRRFVRGAGTPPEVVVAANPGDGGDVFVETVVREAERFGAPVRVVRSALNPYVEPLDGAVVLIHAEDRYVADLWASWIRFVGGEPAAILRTDTGPLDGVGALPSVDVLGAAPADSEAASTLDGLRAKYGIGDELPEVQRHAFAATRLLLRALAVSGEDPDVAKLTHALEQVREFDTGSTAPVSFGPERRTGLDRRALSVIGREVN